MRIIYVVIIVVTEFNICTFQKTIFDPSTPFFGICLHLMVSIFHGRGMHYDNTPMQLQFLMENVIFFLTFSQNIDRGYTLYPQ